MVAKLFAVAVAVAGAMSQMIEERDPQSVNVGGQTITVTGAPPGSEIIIIATNAGGGASWSNINQPTGSTGTIHQVTVGGDAGLVYSPNTVNAAVGDMVQFNFMSNNHTVTQSAFNTPCVNSNAFDSNFVPNVNNTVNPPPAMKLLVNATTPQWFYCKQKGHCGKGMTFSINPTAAKTQAMFMQMAMQQNGTATAGAPSTSTSAAAAPPPPASSAAAPPPAAASAAPPSVASGTGSTGSDGSCTCSCLCGVAQFPMASIQGVGNFGGMSGALPMSPAPGK